MAEGITIEKLVAKLEADIKDYKASLKEASTIAKTETGAIQGTFDAMKGGISSAGQSLTSFKSILTAVAAGAVASFVGSTIEAADELGRLSQTTGFSTKSIQEFKFAASQLNVEQSTLTQSMTIFNRTIGEAASGNAEAANAFSVLGISIRDSSGNLKSSDQLFREVSTSISRVGSSAEQAAVAQELFGRSGSQLIPMLSQGADGLKKFEVQAQQLGLVLDKELIESADAANDQLSIMKQVISADLTKAVLTFAPAIGWAAKQLATMADSAAWVVSEFSRLYGDKIKNAVGITDAHAASTAKAAEQNAKLAENSEKAGAAQGKVNLHLAERNRIQAEANKLVGDSKSSNKGEQIAKELETLRQAEAMKLELKGDTQAAIMERETQLQEFYVEQNAKQIETLIAQNEAMMAIDEEKYAQDIEANQRTIETMLAAKMVGADKELQIKKKLVEQEKKQEEVKMQNVQGAMNWISQLQYSKNKEMAAIGKAAAIVSTTISTYKAAQEAYAAMAGIPFVGPGLGIAAAAAATAAGLSRVSQIAGVDIGFASGADMVPGVGRRDSVPAMVMPGERIIKTDTNKVLEGMLQEYQRTGSFGGGAVRVELVMTDNLVDFIQARIVEQQRLSTSLVAA